jgi:hypothetical protein
MWLWPFSHGAWRWRGFYSRLITDHHPLMFWNCWGLNIEYVAASRSCVTHWNKVASPDAMKLISRPENRQCEVRQLNHQTDNVKKYILSSPSSASVHNKIFPSPTLYTLSNIFAIFTKVVEVIFTVVLPILVCCSKGYARFWDVKKRKLVVKYRRFGTSYR